MLESIDCAIWEPAATVAFIRSQYADGLRVVLAIECHGAGERQRLPLRRIGGKRLRDELERLALQRAALRGAERVGVVGQHRASPGASAVARSYARAASG